MTRPVTQPMTYGWAGGEGQVGEVVRRRGRSAGRPFDVAQALRRDGRGGTTAWSSRRVRAGRVVGVAGWREGGGLERQPEAVEVAADVGVVGDGFDERHAATALRAREDVLGPRSPEKIRPVHARLAGEQPAVVETFPVLGGESAGDGRGDDEQRVIPFAGAWKVGVQVGRSGRDGRGRCGGSAGGGGMTTRGRRLGRARDDGGAPR